MIRESLENILIPPLWEKSENKFDFSFFFLTAAGGANLFFSGCKLPGTVNTQHDDKNHLVRR